ncbi:hypothetical protein FHS91_001282 [Sphingobium xanthum]|uniref:winged helix-turn-helix domain-containing protein n=1 Tax=Sphingobium xanthum TaxID=1387165 RepID=UPI001C8CB8C5|nr:helix-turn-helix domain-containing protein [Sphingobium xanthum]
MQEQVDREQLTAIAGRVRSSLSLGRSETLRRLFDFLLERTLAGQAPKEIELASHVFGRSNADLMADATVRVYVHRLRRKLEEHYAGPGRLDTERLLLPKGEYRFHIGDSAEIAEAADVPVDETTRAPASAAPPGKRSARWLYLAGGLIGGAALMLAAQHLQGNADNLDPVRESPPWAALLESRRPLAFVAGDYYLVGERDKPGADPARLVRDFSINSRAELDELLMHRPELRERYVDLGLSYLPVSSAYALKAIMPIVSPSLAERRFSPLVLASRLSPPMLKSSDMIYVGLLSGLDLLEQPVFAGSRFAFAGSYDEIIDSQTGKIYVSDPPKDGEAARRNYAYIALLPGPTGNRILVLAGTRDPALLQAADILTNPEMMAKLHSAGKDGYFEALYAVDGVGAENLRGTLIAENRRSIDGMWDSLGEP